MTAAGFVALEGVAAHQLAEFEEVGDASAAFEGLIEFVACAGNADVFPEFFAQLRDARDRFAQTFGVARHAAFVPEEKTEFAMEGIDRAFAIHVQHPLRAGAHFRFSASLNAG